MFLAFISIDGITTREHDSGGMPSEKSIRGRDMGLAINVAIQFTNATAKLLEASKKIIPTSLRVTPYIPPS
jgi:hypothetical protein